MATKRPRAKSVQVESHRLWALACARIAAGHAKGINDALHWASDEILMLNPKSEESVALVVKGKPPITIDGDVLGSDPVEITRD